MEQLAPFFDMETQRFLVQRWQSEQGLRVMGAIRKALEERQSLDPILEPYVLHHPANMDPYGYPVYPIEIIRTQSFWVLATNDLRGIQLHDVSLESCASLEHHALTNASFANCNFSNGSLGNCELSYAHVEHCNFEGTNFSLSTAHKAHFESCNFKDASFWQCHIAESRFHDCDMRGIYWEDALVEKINIDYQTRIDIYLRLEWRGRQLPLEQKPDLLREIRIAYEQAQLWHIADEFLFREKRAHRKYIMYPKCREEPTFKHIHDYLEDLSVSFMCGYGTKPWRVFWLAIYIMFFYTFVYMAVGIPGVEGTWWQQFMGAIYFSMSNFSTLGYGDLYYGADQPYIRFFSTTEAWVGAMLIAFFVVVIGRKFLR